MELRQLVAFACVIIAARAQICPPTEIVLVLDIGENAFRASTTNSSNPFELITQAIVDLINHRRVVQAGNNFKIGIYGYGSSETEQEIFIQPGTPASQVPRDISLYSGPVRGGSWSYKGLELITTRPTPGWNNLVIFVSSQGSGVPPRQQLARDQVARVASLGWNINVIAVKGVNSVDYVELTDINGGLMPNTLTDPNPADPDSPQGYKQLFLEFRRIIENVLCNFVPTGAPTTPIATITRSTTYSDNSQKLCPLGFCKNGGICTGLYTCDCSTTEFYGDECQYTKNEIPVKVYKFITTYNQTVITSIGNLPYSGQVEVIKDGDNSFMTIPAGSYVNIDQLLAKCINDIDYCTSGFSITITHSFSPVDKEGIHFVLSTGAGLEEGVRGISLYYKSGYLYCYIVTSTQVWGIVKRFELAESKWYEMTVSWHPGQGLVLLQGNNVIGSNTTSFPLPTNATVSRSLLIGSGDGTSSTTVLIVRELITVPVFWKEVQRSTVLFTKDTPSGSSVLEIAQIVGIAVGCFVALVFAVVAVVWVISYSRRRSTNEQSRLGGIKNDNVYITPIDNPYSMSSTNTYHVQGYSSAYNNANSSSDYDYITVLEPDTSSDEPALPRR